MDWKFIMCLLVMCSTTIWKLLEILTYGEIQVRQVDDVMTLYMAFTIYSEENDSEEKDNWDGPQENGRDQQLSMPDEKEDKKYSKYDNLR